MIDENHLSKPKYKLKFLIEYGAGSLWADNEVAYEKFGVGPLDETTYSLDGKILEYPKIKLPGELEQTRQELIYLYYQSLDQNNPTGPSLWNNEQLADYQKQTLKLYKSICKFLGDEFEVIYST